MTLLTKVQKRRLILTLCAFIAAPLVFTKGDFGSMVTSPNGETVLAWWLAVSSALCAWLVAPRDILGTRVDVLSGVIAGIFTALITPVLFGLGLGVYSFVTTLGDSPILSSLALMLYIPVISFVGAIVFYGVFSLPLSALVGGLIYAPVFGNKNR